MENPDTIQPTSNNYSQSPTSAESPAATHTVADAAGQAKAQAASLANQVKDKALSLASEQKDGLADRIDDIAKSVHKSGEQFAGQQDWIAGAIERGAGELNSLATSLRENDLTGLMSQVRSIARRQPALFVGACLAGGFALARVGKLVAADLSSDDLPTMPELRHAGE